MSSIQYSCSGGSDNTRIAVVGLPDTLRAGFASKKAQEKVRRRVPDSSGSLQELRGTRTF